MQIYINKNNQQLGPYDEEKVGEMLKNGQLSTNDLGIRQGEQHWQPLGNLLSQFSISPPIPPESSPTKKGFGCSRLFGVGLILLSILTLLGGLANYSMRNFNDFNCTQAESQKQKVDEAFAKLSPKAKNASPTDILDYNDQKMVEEYKSASRLLATYKEGCSYLRQAKSYWVNVTIGITVVSLLIGIVGLAMIFVGRKK